MVESQGGQGSKGASFSSLASPSRGNVAGGSGPEVAMMECGVGGDNRNCGREGGRGFPATAPRWQWVCPRLKGHFPLGLGFPGNSLGRKGAFREF